MSDDLKGPLLSDKGGEGIPPPAVAPATQSQKATKPLKYWLKCFAASSLLFLIAHRYVESFKPEIEAETEAWLANPFARGPHWPGKGHHKPILNGKAAEKLYLTIPNEASALEASRHYAGKPHIAGSVEDFETAKDFLALLQNELGAVAPTGDDDQPIYSAGTAESRNATLSISTLDKPTAWIDVYYPVMNTPLNHSVEILDEDGNAFWSAPLEEEADETDPDAGKYRDSVPTFHGLSRSGDVKGKLLFANYGRQEDYQALLEQGVNFTGKIVLVKYGGIFRGLKVKGAEELGAAGVLIYSDPSDDGSVTIENGYLPYPYGPARNPTSVQRGSVQYLSLYPGDPTTPGYPAYENSTRTEGANIPSIPSLPLSWANAKVLLQEIAEGGQNRTVSFVNHVDTRVIPIWNTYGVIPGHIKDEVVVIGNHRDAWVLGAVDPSSGTASVHEVVRGFGELLKKGWKPLRTIVFASWDAEEYGLIGSTEWGEDFAEFVDKHVVAYINLDSSVSGSRFSISASPSLAHLVREAALDIPHPTKPGLTLWDATKDRGVLTGHVKEEVQAMYDDELQQADGLGVNPLGSGSDFTVFLQRIGVASANGGFGSTLQDPVYHYHSIFDSERWQELYGDPGFFRHVAVSKYLGLTALRLADAIVLPLNTTHYSLELESYLKKVESIASTTSLDVDFSSLRESIHALQTASAALDGEKASAERELKHIIHKIVKRKTIRRILWRAICKLKRIFGKECHHRPPFRGINPAFTGEAFGAERAPVWFRMRSGSCHLQGPHPPKGAPWQKLREAVKRVRNVNAKLVAFERGFISEDGIKDREWYRHLVVAPGKWLGYGATTLPALTESLTIEKNTTLAKLEAKRLETLIDALAKELKP
ncbi:Zn-dependent exopeptidase [Irpex rosettiformis]|uniref:Zn-dependent exopeptidase n=1 Tax=Irpex rosettiformis TaxID=378272 RepID=A0ACB8U418_9APHY|nr:Zn-dependent exopeptidase [Irpex rosettiformis]